MSSEPITQEDKDKAELLTRSKAIADEYVRFPADKSTLADLKYRLEDLCQEALRSCRGTLVREGPILITSVEKGTNTEYLISLNVYTRTEYRQLLERMRSSVTFIG